MYLQLFENRCITIPVTRIAVDILIVTARVRSTGRYCFHRCLSVNNRGGPSLDGGGGTPSQVWGGGVPQTGLDSGGYPIQGLRWGYPIPGLGWGGVPHTGLDGGGNPSLGWAARSGWWGTSGYPPGQVWMVGGNPIPGLDGGGYPIPGVGVPWPGLDGWGVPHPRSGWWGVPWPGLDVHCIPQDGVPPTMTGWGTPPTMTRWGTPHHDWMGYPPPPATSIASTCYAAGDMPLAFMQEDFLVLFCFQVVVNVRCLNNQFKRLTFKSAASCACSKCGVNGRGGKQKIPFCRASFNCLWYPKICWYAKWTHSAIGIGENDPSIVLQESWHNFIWFYENCTV